MPPFQAMSKGHLQRKGVVRQIRWERELLSMVDSAWAISSDGRGSSGEIYGEILWFFHVFPWDESSRYIVAFIMFNSG